MSNLGKYGWGLGFAITMAAVLFCIVLVASMPAGLVTQGLQTALLPGLLLSILAALVFLSHGVRAGQRLHHFSTCDPLTGLYNRRAAMKQAEAERFLALRAGRSFCVVLMDIDHFKRINHSHGHDAGDLVLKFVSERLQELMRPSDVVARMGDEEFLVLLPSTDLQDARRVVERLRQAWQGAQLRHGQQSITFTCSFGLSAWRGAHETLQALLIRTDGLLDLAKQHGRDRCVADANPTSATGLLA